MTPEAVSARLEAVGVDAGPEERMKDLAAKAGVEPLDLLKAVLIEGYQPKKAE